MIYSVRKRNKALYKIKYSTRSHLTLTSSFLVWLSGRNNLIVLNLIEKDSGKPKESISNYEVRYVSARRAKETENIISNND